MLFRMTLCGLSTTTVLMVPVSSDALMNENNVNGSIKRQEDDDDEDEDEIEEGRVWKEEEEEVVVVVNEDAILHDQNVDLLNDNDRNHNDGIVSIVRKEEDSVSSLSSIPKSSATIKDLDGMENNEHAMHSDRDLKKEKDEEVAILIDQMEETIVDEEGKVANDHPNESIDEKEKLVSRNEEEEEKSDSSMKQMKMDQNDDAKLPSTVAVNNNGANGIVKPKDELKKPEILVNYAHKNSGAIILSSSKGLDGASNILVSDRDKYAIAPCELLPQKLWVIIALPEDILVKSISIANYERYSSSIKEFQVLASTQIPTKEDGDDAPTDPNSIWTDLGTYKVDVSNARNTNKEEMFNIMKPAWARYVKIVFLNHSGVEFYCTVSQVKVHGSTMVQGFHEEYMKEKEALNIDDDDDVNTENEEVNDNLLANDNSNQGDALKPEELSEKQDLTLKEVIDNVTSLAAEINNEGDMTIAKASDVTDKSEKNEDSVPNNSQRIVVENSLTQEREDIAQIESMVSVEPANEILSSENKKIENEVRVETKRHSTTDSSDNFQSNEAIADSNSVHKTQELGQEEFVAKIAPKPSNSSLNATSPNEIENISTMESTVSSDENKVVISLKKDSSSIEKIIKEQDEGHQLVNIDQAIFDVVRHRKYSACLENLNYTSFKEAKRNKALQKQKQIDAKAEHAASGSAFPMEPIFKTLSNDIKSMIVNQTILDQYLVQVNNCYQTIIWEMEHEIIQTEIEFRARLEELEEKQRTSFKEVFVLSLALVAVSLCILVSFALCLKCRRKNGDLDDFTQPSEQEHEIITPLKSSYGWNPYNSIARGNSRTSPGEPDRSAGGTGTRNDNLEKSAPFFPDAQTLTI